MKKACADNHSFKLKPLPENYKVPPGFTATQARRSITSSYFAEAFYKANK